MTRKKQKYESRLKVQALNQLDRVSLDDDKDNLSKRCKINFSYFDHSQPAGQNFSDLSKEQLCNLLKSLVEFSRRSLEYWETQGSRFVMYNKFPTNTEFIHPRHVPHQVCWGRFRLGSRFRLVGFTVPSEIQDTPHHITKKLFDKNTFYIVFIDKNHLFWKTERR